LLERIDINVDCGESFGNWRMGIDDRIMPLITTANVACGFHAGDPMTMLRTVDCAKAAGAAIGTHPGLPDLAGFGRRAMALSADETYACMLYQAGALRAMVEAKGMALHHLKPHGAFYGMLNKDEALAAAAVRAILDVCSTPMLYWAGPIKGRALTEAALAAGVRVVPEVYFDLEYDDDGFLILQRGVGQVDIARTRERIRKFFLTGEITSVSGKRVAVPAESICVHGDGPSAIPIVESIRAIAGELGIVVAPVSA
jgi:5-oxoprolinase (ATP-hydrolysing) subunit A